eukprot:9611326-Ditylum_brightwellii.AAC.1
MITPNMRNNNSNKNEPTLLITNFPPLSTATVKKKNLPDWLTVNKITLDHVQNIYSHKISLITDPEIVSNFITQEMKTMLYHQKSLTAITHDITQVDFVSSFQLKGWK